MNNFDTTRRWYIRLLETLEEMALATVARIVPWLIPIAPAWAIKTSVETFLQVDPIIALLMALAFEGMGIYVSHVAFLSWVWNKTRNKNDPSAPFSLMVALVSVYLIVGGILVLLIKIYPPSTVFAPAAFLPLGLVVYTAWAIHMELSSWRNVKEEEALDRKVKTGVKIEIKSLTQERDDLLNEIGSLAQQIDSLTAQLENLNSQIKQAQLSLSQPRQAESVSKTVPKAETSVKALEKARQIKLNNDSQNMEERRQSLVKILSDDPEIGVTELARALQVSRQTIYNDLEALNGKVSK